MSNKRSEKLLNEEDRSCLSFTRGPWQLSSLALIRSADSAQLKRVMNAPHKMADDRSRKQ